MDIRISALARFLDLRELEWRHHGLGMLQGEIDETLRIHLWHPDLRTIPVDNYRMVHDHRFDLESVVVRGRLTDCSWYVIPWKPGDNGGWNTKCWEIRHAKIQTTFDTLEKTDDHAAVAVSGDVQFIHNVCAWERWRKTIQAGEQYKLERREFHTTLVSEPCMTIVRRSNFDKRPARVLGDIAHSAIVRYGAGDPGRGAHATLLRRVIEDARAWLGGQL